MPGGDRTGPQGLGPMTGWGMGNCTDASYRPDLPSTIGGGAMGWGGGRGRGLARGRNMGFGRGRGGGFGAGGGNGWRHRHWFYATGQVGWQRAQAGWAVPGAPVQPTGSREETIAALRVQTESLEQALSRMQARLRDLENPAPDAPGKET